MAYAHSTAIIATPIGGVRIEAIDDMLLSISIGPWQEPRAPTIPVLKAARDQLQAYFAGGLNRFDLPLKPSGSPRGPAMRSAIADIEYGQTISYGALAERIGSSARAIGQACRTNPFPILVPCHRVLGADGKLGRYSAGEGPVTKRLLLEHERAEGWLI